jgi:thymidylate synthase (FAD)
MKIIDPSYEIMTPINGLEMLKHLELAGRVCYKSEDKITDESCKTFTKMIKTRKHESVLEHCSVSVRFICNRGFTHELVRHRVASFSQESTRYVNYSKGKHGSEITVVKPPKFDEWDIPSQAVWRNTMKSAETGYMLLLENGRSPQEARGVLPIDVKTEIVITANLREWMHIFELRCSSNAHPSMQQLMIPLREEFKKELSELFC